MNRYTIIAEDKFVSVDGVGYENVTLIIDPLIHAVQWYGTYGEIEYTVSFDPVTKTILKPQNELFEDPSRFQAALDAWQVADLQAKEAAEAASQTPANGGV